MVVSEKMMTKMSMSTEGFLMAKEHHRLMAGATGRMEKLLGNFPSKSSHFSSSDSGDLNEDDVWGTWTDGGSNPHSSVYKDAENFRSKTETGASEGVARFIHNQKGRQQQQRRVGLETGGLCVAFEDPNVRSRFSPLTRTSRAMKVTPGRSMSVKMMPHAGDSNGRHMMHQSAPVNVPEWGKVERKENARCVLWEWEEEEEEEEEEEQCDRVPPHEYVARSQMSTTSVFQGVGRTLKGRDMSRVRNAVWRQTGFLG